ncbi:MAG: hypothetical protein LBU70_04035 [Chitinispirillales bacterium]|jgi:predicted transposase/invertase (TIGR01784 family)|nr:hypothetical protein [Chitinispirillales bacterium]
MAKTTFIKHKTSTKFDVSKKAELPRPRSLWTDIFTKVLTMLLRGYKVDIFTEYELYKKPMRIDIVVINLLEDVVIENTVMKFFKKHNIVEFKGPKDTLNIRAFDRVLSYFYAYLSQKSAMFDESTITFVTVRRPEKLIRVLQKERKYKIIASESQGIYYIDTEGRSTVARIPAMQLVVSSELSAEDAEWIKAVRDDWTLEYGVEILEKIEDTANSHLREVARLLWLANNINWEEGDVGTINTMHPVLRKRLKKMIADYGWEEEARQEGWEKGIEEERRKNAKAMKAEGLDANTIAKITGLTVDDIRRM